MGDICPKSISLNKKKEYSFFFKSISGKENIQRWLTDKN